MSIYRECSATDIPSTNSVSFFDELLNCEVPTLVTDRDNKQIQHIIATAMVYPMEKIVKRYMKENDICADVAAKHEKELKRFLAICAIYHDPIGMRASVDELWHSFITFTEEYALFCEQVAGHFIHHVPNDETTSKSDSRTSALRFNMAYESLFNATPPIDVWPPLSDSSDLICGKGCVSRCGRFHTQKQ